MIFLIIILFVLIIILAMLRFAENDYAPIMPTVYIPGPDTYESLVALSPGVPREWLNDTQHRIFAARFPGSNAPLAFVIIDTKLSRVVYQCSGILRIEQMHIFQPYIRSVTA